MRVEVTLRRNSDGQEVTFDDSGWDERNDPSDAEFWWTEGNGSCDCNRFLSFERAQGREPDFTAAECSDGKYTLVLLKCTVLGVLPK